MTRAFFLRSLTGLVGIAACGLLLVSGVASAQPKEPESAAEIQMVEPADTPQPASQPMAVQPNAAPGDQADPAPVATNDVVAPVRVEPVTAPATPTTPVQVTRTVVEEVPVDIGQPCVIEKTADGQVVESPGCSS